MKTKIIKSVLLVVLSFIFTLSYSQKDFTKNYEKNYDLNSNSIFKLTNKFGKVHIENHDANKLEILVTVTVKEKSEEKANEFFKKIKINFSESGDKIIAETELKEKIKNKKFSIDYHVKMPENLKINLYNNFGDIFINKLTSKSVISSKFGSLKINEFIVSELEDAGTVRVKYSTGDIAKCDFMNVEVKFSDQFTIGESKAIVINSGYSSIDLGNANFVKATSEFDPEFEINKVAKLDLTGKYSKYEIGTLIKVLKAEISYSSMEIDDLKAGFKSVYANSEFGNLEIDVDENASYKFEGKAEFGEIESNVKASESDHGMKKYSSGFVGNDKSSESKVTVICKFGNIEVK